jgi:site-specific recombinase XerD
MKYKEAVDIYLANLNEAGYSHISVLNKGVLLRNHLSYALSLFFPGITKIINDIDVPLFYSRMHIIKNLKRKKRNQYARHFLETFREDTEDITFLNLFVFLQDYQRRFPLNDKNEEMERQKGIESFCKAIAFQVKIDSITEKVYLQCLEYLKPLKIKNLINCTRDFFIFYFEKDMIGFSPYEGRKPYYERCFESDFIGRGNRAGRWVKCLKDYIHYLRYERNLSDGGIDCQVRKLKIFVLFLDSQKIKKPDINILKRFIKKKRGEGIKEITISKYIYTIKYFFNFLIDKGHMKTNPANDIKVKYCQSMQGEVLTEIEVNRVLEYFENIIFSTRQAKEIKKMKIYFRAVRDLCLFELFTFTGLRLSEVCGMTFGDINFDKRIIDVICKGNKKYRQKKRQITLDDYLWTTLQSYLKARHYPGQKYLWITFEGRPLSNSGIHRIIVSCIREAGIKRKISPQRLRASCASLYVSKGMDPFSLKSLLGHQSIVTTMNKYTKLTEDQLREIWEKTNPLRGMDDDE